MTMIEFTDGVSFSSLAPEQQDAQHALQVQCVNSSSTLTAQEALDLLDWLYAQRTVLFELAHQDLKQYKVAMWQTPLSAKPIAEIDVEAEDAKAAAELAMQKTHVSAMGVIVVLSGTEQVTFFDAECHQDEGILHFSRTEQAEASPG